MLNKIKRFFAMRGTWEWACKQMEQGKMVRPKSASGSVHYRLDKENQRRIQCSFNTDKLLKDDPRSEWENANIFLSDFETTDWVIY